MDVDGNVIADGERFDLRRLFNAFLKVLGLFFIGFAIQYWLKAIGVPDETVRFDTMPAHWKAAVAFFAVINPIVGLGLWGNFKWGLVVWAMAALAEVVMFGLYPQHFGPNDAKVVFHIACCLTFITYYLVLKFQALRKRSGG